ncbi:hypothetical protein BHM03_00012355, partial [Ensete ventricosum]
LSYRLRGNELHNHHRQVQGSSVPCQPTSAVQLSRNWHAPMLISWMTRPMTVLPPCSATSTSMESTHLGSLPVNAVKARKGWLVLPLPRRSRRVAIQVQVSRLKPSRSFSHVSAYLKPGRRHVS